MFHRTCSTRSQCGHMWHDSGIRVARPVHLWGNIFCRTCSAARTVHLCRILRVTWLIHICVMSHAYVWHDSFIFVSCLMHMCDMTHSYEMHFCNGSDHVNGFPYAPNRAMLDMTHSYVEHDPSMCVTWLIHMCDMTHSYVFCVSDGRKNELNSLLSNSFFWMSHVPHVPHESCPTFWMSHVPHGVKLLIVKLILLDESCPTWPRWVCMDRVLWVCYGRNKWLDMTEINDLLWQKKMTCYRNKWLDIIPYGRNNEFASLMAEVNVMS